MKVKEEFSNYAGNVRELNVYRKAFDTAMEIFELSKEFPKEERYSLTDQIRRSSRSICANLSEAWRKVQDVLEFKIIELDTFSCVKGDPRAGCEVAGRVRA